MQRDCDCWYVCWSTKDRNMLHLLDQKNMFLTVVSRSHVLLKESISWWKWQPSEQKPGLSVFFKSCAPRHVATCNWLVVTGTMEFYDFPYVGKNYPNWLICFRGVETTNQAKMELAALLRAHLDEKLRPSSPAKESPAQCAMARGLFNFQKGTPWECGFSLHSATTDTAHVRWFSHCFAAIDNSAWFFWNG